MSVKLGQMDSKDLFTIPNIITYFRIICVPVFIVLMALGGVKNNFAMFYSALGVFLVAAGSDMFDGWIARKFNMQSGVGMLLDPVADKLMHVSVLFCLSLCTGLTPLGGDLVADGVLDSPWFVHYAFVIVICAKELLQIIMALVFAKKGVSLKANWLGKVSSFTISMGVILAFFHNYVAYADWGILAWGIAMSYASAIGYLRSCIEQISRIKKGEIEAATADSVKEADIETVRKKKEGIED